MDYSCPYEDQTDLDDDEIFYRFLPKSMCMWDGDDLQVQSNAFGEIGQARADDLGYPERATSIAFHNQILESGITVEEVAATELGPDCGIAKLRVGDVRTIEPAVGIRRDGWGKPWHGILFAVTRKRMKSEKSSLRDHIIEIVRYPDRQADG